MSFMEPSAVFAGPGIQELSTDELDAVSGAAIPLALVPAVIKAYKIGRAIGIGVGLFGGGYAIYDQETNND